MVATTDTPTLEDLIALVGRTDREDEIGPIPAEVLAYDSAKQTCNARPLVLVAQGGELQELPICRDVPVMWLSGGGWSLTGPMAAGDIVWLVAAGADIGQWKVSGAPRSPAASHRRLSPSDMVALPGTRPFSAPLSASAVASDGVVLAGLKVYLGDSTATDFVALKSLVEDALGKLYAEIAGHGHPVAGAATTGYTPPALNPINPVLWPPDTGATKVLAI